MKTQRVLRSQVNVGQIDHFSRALTRSGITMCVVPVAGAQNTASNHRNLMKQKPIDYK